MKSRFLNVTPEVSQNPRSRCKETDGEHFSHSRASLPQRGGRGEGWREKGWWCKNRICCTTASQDAIWQRCPEWGWVSLLMKPNDSVRDERGRQGKYNCEGEALAQLQGVRCGERKGCTGKYDTQHPALHHVQYVHCHCAAEPRKWLQWKNLQQLAHIFPACTHPRDQREMYF